MFDEDRLNFPFPLFTTSMHMVVQFFLAALVLYFIPSLRPGASHNSDAGRSRHEHETQTAGMTKMFYLTRIAPCGVATGLDIGLGNTSLKFISLTFYSKLPPLCHIKTGPSVDQRSQPCANHRLLLSCFSSPSLSASNSPHGVSLPSLPP